ncbi:putative transcription factor MBF1 family [Helianthus annuus]|nr:putative transcription factor MBF1 family [Helianthus annuus]
MIQFLHSCFSSCSIDSLQRLLHLPLYNPSNKQISSSSQRGLEPVVIRKKAPTAAARKDEKAVNTARRAGAEIETVRKGT